MSARWHREPTSHWSAEKPMKKWTLLIPSVFFHFDLKSTQTQKISKIHYGVSFIVISLLNLKVGKFVIQGWPIRAMIVSDCISNIFTSNPSYITTCIWMQTFQLTWLFPTEAKHFYFFRIIFFSNSYVTFEETAKVTLHIRLRRLVVKVKKFR